MFVVVVSIQVVPQHVDAFLAATLENARHTRREPGNVRFDVLRQEPPQTGGDSPTSDDAERFTLYEAYRRPEDFTAHQQTPHYLAWRAAVADWMAAPRVGVKHTSLDPADSEW